MSAPLTEPSPRTDPSPLTEQRVGERLDRAPWHRMHTVILLALGAGWLFDSFEVQMFSVAIGPLGDHFGASTFERDAVLAVWLGGILVGAVIGGRLADRFGRRRMFVATLLWYAGFTVLTGFSPTLGSVYVLRFLAALGVGAEYAIINTAIAEFMPARVRGTANAVVMNFWPAGAIIAGLLGYFALDTLGLSSAISWRYLFVVGGLIALVVLFFRRRIPESPRWLLTQGRHAEAEQVIRGLESSAEPPSLTPQSWPLTTLTLASQALPITQPHHQHQPQPMDASQPRPQPDPPPDTPGRPPADPPDSQSRGFSAFAELIRHYPGRLALGSLLDLAEAFGFYGLFALLSVIVLPQVHISQAGIPLFYIVANVGALAGGLIMASLFDRVGHRRMVGVTYLLAAGGVALLALATASGSAAWVLVAFVAANGFGTAAWTAVYPTFTELFPTHLRGAGVGICVGIGRLGAIVGALALPSLAAHFGASVSYLTVAAFWLAGAAAIAIYALHGGADGARRSLEQLAPRRIVILSPTTVPTATVSRTIVPPATRSPSEAVV